jgi:hypothetical protein
MGKAELCVLYDHGGDDTALFVSPAGGNNFQQVWRSGKGGLAWNRMLVESAKPVSSPPLVLLPTESYCVQAFSEDGTFSSPW